MIQKATDRSEPLAPPALSGLGRPVRRTLRDQIYDQLRSAVMTGEFTPGQHLGITALADALGVSAMPVREALRQLVAEGALEMLPNRMVKVPQLTLALHHEILDVRLMLEGTAAERAAGNLTPTLWHTLRGFTDAMAEADAVKDTPRYFGLNRDFHFAIYAAAGSAVLMRHIELMWLRIGPAIRLVGERAQGFAASEENHRRIMAALEARDGPATGAALRRDLLDAAPVIASVLGFGEAGAPPGTPK